MKYIILLAVLIGGCTTVNTNGSIKHVKYSIVKDGSNHQVTVEADAVRCPIVESEIEVKSKNAKVVTTCKTIFK